MIAAAPPVSQHAAPMIKAAGGKTGLLPELVAHMPEHFARYYEPFAGGAALFFRAVGGEPHQRAHVGCDQAMLVRKERKVRSPSRNTEASSSGCESRPIRPARRVGSEPCDGHDGERAEAGRQRARRCVGTQTSELCDVSLETGDISSVQGIPCPEDHDIDLTRWHRRFDVLDGVAVHGAFEEDDPVTWDTRALGGDTGGRRRGRPKSGPACVAGVGGAL